MKNTLTIIIPTHERHTLLERSIHYYTLMNVSVLIVDSSPMPLTVKLPENIDYLHLAEFFFGDKIYYALDKIDTPYACLCADDDFLTENGLYEGLNFLENHEDYESVHGQYINFDPADLKNINPMYIDCINHKNDSNDISERLKDCFKAPYIYALHRTKNLKHCLEITLGLPAPTLVEMCIPLVSLLLGKQKTLPIFWQARDRRRYSKYLDEDDNDYLLMLEKDGREAVIGESKGGMTYVLNEIDSANPYQLNVITNWEAYFLSNDGIQFKNNFLLKAFSLTGGLLKGNVLFDLAFDEYLKKEKSKSNKIFPLSRKIKSFIIRKLNKKAMISGTYIAKSGYPWNDITAMNDWNLIKETIIKFSI